MTGHFWTTWIDNMSTGIFEAPGSFDPATNTCSCRGEMADPISPPQRSRCAR